MGVAIGGLLGPGLPGGGIGLSGWEAEDCGSWGRPRPCCVKHDTMVSMNRESLLVIMVLAHSLLLAPAVAQAGEPAPAFIIKDGKARAEIVIAVKPTRSARLAASELQTYLERITVAKLAVVTTPSAT